MPLRRIGFTLVELLVVIAIIAVLIAILLPALARAREQANRVACSSNLRQMQAILYMYEGDHKELPPGNWYETFSIRGGAHVVLRDRYSMKLNVTLCPSAEEYPKVNEWQYRWTDDDIIGKMKYRYLAGNGGSLDGFGNPMPDAPGIFGTTNGWRHQSWEMYDYGWVPKARINKTKRWHEMPLMMDIALFRGLHSLATVRRPPRSNHPLKGSIEAVGENVSFMDGHVEWQELKVGKSWLLGEDIADYIWWTPTFNPPPGALY